MLNTTLREQTFQQQEKGKFQLRKQNYLPFNQSEILYLI